MLAERVRQPAEAGDRSRGGGQQDQRTREPDEHLQRIADVARHVRADLSRDADERRAQPVAAEQRSVIGRECRDRHHGDRDVEHDDEPDRAEQRSRQVAARPARLLREIRDGLESRVREHRQRDREKERMPRRRGPERRSGLQCVCREEQREAEAHDQQLCAQVDERDQERPAVQPRAVDQADHCDPRDHEAADDDVPRPVHSRKERPGYVVRDEQRRERDHDQVVEEEDPAGDETPEVVEGDPDEGCRASGLADRRGPLGVRERDDEEQEPGREQDRGREAEGVQRDDPEREVDRRRDLAVGDREERRSAEDALQARQLACHARNLAPGSE